MRLRQQAKKGKGVYVMETDRRRERGRNGQQRKFENKNRKER